MPGWSPLDLLPGCYAAALALALAAALGRWFEPLPKRVAAAAGGVVCLLFGGALFGGRVLLPLDNLRGEVPFRQLAPARPLGNLIQGDLIELVAPSLAAAGRGFAAGRWPLWNARAGAGMPLLADPQAQALSPLALLTLPLSPVRGAAVLAALRVYLAVVFTFLLLRRQGLGGGPALAGGLAYGLSGCVVLWVGWPLASTAALLPAVLYALARVATPGGGRRRDGVLLAAALAALLLAGHPETILYGCLLAAAFATQRVWRDCPAGGRARVVGRLAAAAAVAGGLAAPALLPALDYLPQTLRAERLAESVAPAPVAPAGGGAVGGGIVAGSGGLARRWLPIVAANAYGNSQYFGYWGLSNTNEDEAGFAGTVMALAAALALVAGGAGAAGGRRLPGEAVMLGAAGVCLVVLADPAWVHAALAAVSPALAGSGRCRVVVAFCIAYLGACTLERHRRGDIDRLAVVALASALAAVLAWGYLAHPFPGDPARLAILRLGWLRWQARFLVLATLVLALPVGRARGWLRGTATAVLAAAVGAELLLAHGAANPPMPMRLALPRPRPLAVLSAAAGPAAGERVAALGRALPPNLASLYELTDVRIYNPMAPAPYLALLAPLISGWWGELPELGAPGDPLYRQLGVRYLLTAPGVRLPPPWERVIADGAGWLYWQREIWPRLFVAAGPAGAPLPGGLAVMLLDEQEIAALTGPAAAGAPVVAAGAPAAVAAAAAAGQILLRGSIYQDGGWRLLADRRPVAGPVAGGLVSARLPGGTRQVDLIYRPRGFLIGMLAAAVAAALAATLWLPAPRTGLQ